MTELLTSSASNSCSFSWMSAAQNCLNATLLHSKKIKTLFVLVETTSMKKLEKTFLVYASYKSWSKDSIKLLEIFSSSRRLTPIVVQL